MLNIRSFRKREKKLKVSIDEAITCLVVVIYFLLSWAATAVLIRYVGLSRWPAIILGMLLPMLAWILLIWIVSRRSK